MTRVLNTTDKKPQGLINSAAFGTEEEREEMRAIDAKLDAFVKKYKA